MNLYVNWQCYTVIYFNGIRTQIVPQTSLRQSDNSLRTYSAVTMRMRKKITQTSCEKSFPHSVFLVQYFSTFLWNPTSTLHYFYLSKGVALHNLCNKSYTEVSKYFSTISRPHNSLTVGIVVGTSIGNVTGEPVKLSKEENSNLAALIASLNAQWTDDARSNGGSPDATIKQ